MSAARDRGSPSLRAEGAHAVWMGTALTSPFALKRVAYLLIVPATILAVSMHLGQGVLGLALMVVAFWPFPFRLRAGPEGLRVSWLFVSERIAWREIRSATLVTDGRRFVIGKRGQVLVLERHGNHSVTLRGAAPLLARIAREASIHVG